MAGEGCRRAQRVERGGAGGLCPPCSSRTTRRCAETGASGARRAGRHAPAARPDTPAGRECRACAARVPGLGQARSPFIIGLIQSLQGRVLPPIFSCSRRLGVPALPLVVFDVLAFLVVFSYLYFIINWQRPHGTCARSLRFYFCDNFAAEIICFFLGRETLRRTCGGRLARGGAGLARISFGSNQGIFCVFMGSAQKMTA